MSMIDPFGSGEKLRKLREYHNYTQEHVSEQLGCAPNTLSDYENGKVRIPRERLEKAALFFKVDVNLFFTSEPLTFNMQNSPGANAHNVVHNQHIGDRELLNKMWSHIEDRSKKFEDLYSKTLDLFDRLSRGTRPE